MELRELMEVLRTWRRECEQALALDRNLASAHAFIGLAMLPLEETAEKHVGEQFDQSHQASSAGWPRRYPRLCRTTQNASGDARSQMRTASVVLKKLTGMDAKNRHGPTAVRNSVERAYLLSIDRSTSLRPVSA
jgi:hypothetical protein